MHKIRNQYRVLRDTMRLPMCRPIWTRHTYDTVSVLWCCVLSDDPATQNVTRSSATRAAGKHRKHTWSPKCTNKGDATQQLGACLVAWNGGSRLLPLPPPPVGSLLRQNLQIYIDGSHAQPQELMWREWVLLRGCHEWIVSGVKQARVRNRS